MKKDFNEFRFKGLNYKELSNKYWTMNRVSEDETKIVVKVGDSHLVQTKFGFALILDQENVVFLKDWQVSQNYFGNEVLLQKEFWNVKKWGDHGDKGFLGVEAKNYLFSTWLEIAKEQDLSVDEEARKTTKVRWEK